MNNKEKQPRRLTIKQDIFCDNIVKNIALGITNNAEATRKSGYKGNTTQLSVQANDNLKNPKIIAEIERRKAIIEEKKDFDVKKWRLQTFELYDAAKEAGRLSVAATVNEQLARHIGAFEVDNSQKQPASQLLTREQWLADQQQAQQIDVVFAKIQLNDVVAGLPAGDNQASVTPDPSNQLVEPVITGAYNATVGQTAPATYPSLPILAVNQVEQAGKEPAKQEQTDSKAEPVKTLLDSTLVFYDSTLGHYANDEQEQLGILTTADSAEVKE